MPVLQPAVAPNDAATGYEIQQPLDTTAEQDDGTDSEPAPPVGRNGDAAISIDYSSLPSSTAAGTVANGEPMAE